MKTSPMMPLADFQRAVMGLFSAGFAADDIIWSETLSPPKDAAAFALDAIFVIANSGMKNTVARGIYRRCVAALNAGHSCSTVFGHVGKSAAMDRIWRDRKQLFSAYKAAVDKLAFIEDLPWIGPITKYHLAKNFGLSDFAKPDVHLQRLADHYGTTAQLLCEALSKQTGWKVSTVDTLLWRTCANGLIDSRTAVIKWEPFQNESMSPTPWEPGSLGHELVEQTKEKRAKLTVCRGCGCDDNHACLTDTGPCTWVKTFGDGTGLCSACTPALSSAA